METKTPPALHKPWLVAVWPGMGAVAHLSGTYLVESLGGGAAVEIPPGEHFGTAVVSVRDGILQRIERPRTLLVQWKDPSGTRDLVILLAEGQPTTTQRAYCEEVLLAAREMGVERVFTFAAMATANPPDAPARVFTAATDATVLAELRRHGAEALTQGEIGGLNGYFLSVAAEHGLPGACLLGEIPFYADRVLNPKASAAVLRVFTKLCGLTVDFTAIDAQAEVVEKQLTALAKRMEEQVRAARESQGEPEENGKDWPEPERGTELAKPDAERIESLFREAAKDRTRAMLLKTELDRLGVFARYEDRFLDLFKRSE